MAVTHVNRRGDTYYLQCTLTRTGKTSYSFTRKLTKAPVDEIPEGFEIYEDPERGQVHLRKARPTSILPAERDAVIAALRTQAGLEHCSVQVEADSIVVYLPATDEEDTDRTLDILGGGLMGRAATRAWLMSRAALIKMMRFNLVEKRGRLFAVDRWCFRGGIDTWWNLPGRAPLAELLARYVRHLGQESFYELM